MSAQAQSPEFLLRHRSRDEFDASCEISARLARAFDLDTSLAAVAEIALSIAGVRLFQLEPDADLAPHLNGSLTWGSKRSSAVYGCAVSDVTAAGWSWGKVRIYFDLRQCSLEDPLGFTRFTAQQLASTFNRFALSWHQTTLHHRRERLEERIARRKIAERAKGILAELHGISEAEALAMLNDICHKSRRSLRQVAQSIIFNHTAAKARVSSYAQRSYTFSGTVNGAR